MLDVEPEQVVGIVSTGVGEGVGMTVPGNGEGVGGEGVGGVGVGGVGVGAEPFARKKRSKIKQGPKGASKSVFQSADKEYVISMEVKSF